VLWTVVAVQFLDHVVFNTGATLKDLKNDSAVGATTAATFLGARVEEDNTLRLPLGFSAGLISLRVTAVAAMAAAPLWTHAGFSLVQLAVFVPTAALSVGLLIRAIAGKTFQRRELGRRWVQQESINKLLIPIFLFELIGWRWATYLAVFPLAWFFIWNLALHKKWSSLRRGF
jgi:hypothetical protein